MTTVTYHQVKHPKLFIAGVLCIILIVFSGFGALWYHLHSIKDNEAVVSIKITNDNYKWEMITNNGIHKYQVILYEGQKYGFHEESEWHAIKVGDTVLTDLHTKYGSHILQINGKDTDYGKSHHDLEQQASSQS